jgi:hypothetical protein
MVVGNKSNKTEAAPKEKKIPFQVPVIWVTVTDDGQLGKLRQDFLSAKLMGISQRFFCARTYCFEEFMKL